MTVKAKKIGTKQSKLEKKTQRVKMSKAFTIKKAKGKITFKVTKYDKKAKKKIVVSKSGKVTIKRGLKPGIYKVKVKVTAQGNVKYKAKSKVVTLIIKVA